MYGSIVIPEILYTLRRSVASATLIAAQWAIGYGVLHRGQGGPEEPSATRAITLPTALSASVVRISSILMEV